MVLLLFGRTRATKQQQTIKLKKVARGQRNSGKSSTPGKSNRLQISWGINPKLPAHFTGGRVEPPKKADFEALSAAGKDKLFKTKRGGAG